ncbi:MAG: cation diffusion facilitator family transporter [Candidatus Helarchaeota archaeon]
MSSETARKMLKKGQKASIISILVSICLTIIKLIGGLTSNSTSLISDGINSFSDILVMVVAWAGLRLAQKKPTERFQYGFYKVESITTLGISIFIIIIAINLIFQGIERLQYIPIIEYPLEMIVILIISIIMSLFISIYLIRAGKKINSNLLIVNGKERREDVISSISVLVAIVLDYYNIPFIEGIITIAISIFILKVGIFSIKNTIYSLMDISPSKEIEDIVIDIINNMEDIKGYENLKLRKSGPFIFGEITVMLKKSATISQFDRISSELEQKIKDKVKQIDSFIVRVKPSIASRIRLVIPIDEANGLQSKISDHFGRAKNFLTCIVDNGQIKEYTIIKNPFNEKKVRAGLASIKLLLKKGIDVIISKHLGEISYHVLRDNLIETYKPSCEIASDIIDDYIHNKLKPILKPTKEKEIV